MTSNSPDEFALALQGQKFSEDDIYGFIASLRELPEEMRFAEVYIL